MSEAMWSEHPPWSAQAAKASAFTYAVCLTTAATTESPEDEVEKEQKGSDEPEDLESYREFLVVEAFCPQIQRVSEELDYATNRAYFKNLIESLCDVPARSRNLCWYI